MPWAPATFPLPAGPRDDHTGTLTAVDDAYLTPFERGDLRVHRSRGRWIRGAVHDADGGLVVLSQRAHAGDVQSPIAADPAVVERSGRPKRLDGTWLYGGHWMMHFGHFLVETLSTLWPDPSEHRVDGLLFHRTYQGGDPAGRRGVLLDPERRPWQATFLSLAGYGDVPVRVVQSRPVLAERVLVPARPVAFKAWAGPDAAEVWERVGAAAGAPGSARRVFLSRSAFHRTQDEAKRVRSVEEWDAALDSAFATLGFDVVHPETLPLEEQLRVVRGAEVLAGASGSALHLSAFAGAGTRVVEVGDRRFSQVPGLTQRTLDAARGHSTAFVPHGEPASLAPALAELEL